MRTRAKIFALVVAAAVMSAAGTVAAGSTPLDPAGAPSTADSAEPAVPQAIGTMNPVTSRTFVPLPTPCRFYDSRASTALNGDSRRTVRRPPACAIPSWATALSVSLSAVTPASTGYLRMWGFRLTPSTQTVLQYTRGVPVSTGAVIGYGNSAVVVSNHAGNTHLVIDVVGYYEPPIYGLFWTGSAGAVSSTGMISGAIQAGPGQLLVDFVRDIRHCDLQTTSQAPGALTWVVLQAGGTQVRIGTSRRDDGQPVPAYLHLSVRC